MFLCMTAFLLSLFLVWSLCPSVFFGLYLLHVFLLVRAVLDAVHTAGQHGGERP